MLHYLTEKKDSTCWLYLKSDPSTNLFILPTNEVKFKKNWAVVKEIELFEESTIVESFYCIK